ncbi:MAG: cobalamin-binding protein [Spirochaetes bacterium]|nr:cobalamin-binding protein [Spirochaetota bacterium]
MFRIEARDVFGLIHPPADVHSLGILSFSRVLGDCGIRTLIADEGIGADLEALARGEGGANLKAWIANSSLSVLGFSYRLDPSDALRIFGTLKDFLSRERLTRIQGGKVRAVFFAGLPEACDEAERRFPELAGVFRGDETIQETLERLGVPENLVPQSLSPGLKYDSARLSFGEGLVRSREYLSVKPVDRSSSLRFGLRGEKVTDRIADGKAKGLPPLMRAHAGPYLADRKEAVRLFGDWARSLASGGLLDILSIGTSQLTQSNFGEDWEGKLNGGGVPLATAEEFAFLWQTCRPLFVRAYAGTKKVPELARMYEKTIDIAWHALSFWWFCRLDGRGPNDVLANLKEHFETIRYIASTGKPLEPNVPHHFAFRGADDLSYVVSGYVAAVAAKRLGIRDLILQTMLNTPKYTWGIQDLAKTRVLLCLVRSLESPDFRVHLQPRGGLDYFSPDLEKAKAQLAAVTALMDDIEPEDSSSPQVIHVVSYCEASRLADPPVIEESIRLTRWALSEYRRLKKEGFMEGMVRNPEISVREQSLYRDAVKLIKAAELLIPDTYSPFGLYAMLASGMFALPWLEFCRDEFKAAAIPTRIVSGGVAAVRLDGTPLRVEERIEAMASRLARIPRQGGKDVGSR